MKYFLIRNKTDDELFWNENLGWTDIEHADWFNTSEVSDYIPPDEGHWQAANIVAQGDKFSFEFLF